MAFVALSGVMTAGLLAAATQDTGRDQDRQQDQPDRPTWQQHRDQHQTRQSTMEALKQLEGTWDVKMEIKTSSLTGSSQTREINGTAERKWVLNQNVLKEHTTFESAQAIPGVPAGRRDVDDTNRGIGDDDDQGNRGIGQDRGQQGGQAQDRDRDRLSDSSRHDMQAAGEYQSLGLFGFDEDTRQISHVWADSKSGNLILSVGRYNSSDKEFTFTRHYGEDSRMQPGHPGMRDRGIGDREDSDLYDDDDNILEDDEDDTGGIGQDRDRGQEGMRDRDQQEQGRDNPTINPRQRMTGLSPVVKLKIESKDKHVLTMTKPGGIEYTITYTKKKNQTGTGTSGR